MNGIGPEICIKTINQIYNPAERKIVLFCPSNVIEGELLGSTHSFSYQIIKEKFPKSLDPSYVTIINTGNYKQHVGKATNFSGKAAFVSLKAAYDAVSSKLADAIITAPISKTAFKLAGINYPGQTEILAKFSKSKNYLMVFLSNKFICGLTTIHEPIKSISKLITKQRIVSSIKTLNETLVKDLGKSSPKIAVLGLNPHAGENGNIGKEELLSIGPAIRSIKNISVEGPFVPDAFFGNHQHEDYDAVLGMYHDQVLIPFKMMNFNSGVNYTAGLPIIRTSPDHGTGFDIAGRGIANPQSMLEAVKWAEKIITNRRQKK
ncbi:MAG: 4-hydroxythreonine-4-phosphate dehydrogenase PdxA [Ignavibacteria bacterium RIFOXYA2_FULL_37_17]|nr:MAG: 4-hydroxythreonine-4-phosphate dehydrogenase PdxA [Ignavibacteria bacterium RIFOXYA2_FULL_37_17]